MQVHRGFRIIADRAPVVRAGGVSAPSGLCFSCLFVYLPFPFNSSLFLNGRRCTALTEGGEEVRPCGGGRTPAGACSCPMAKLRYGHVALLGRREASPRSPQTPFPTPPRQAGTGGSAGGWRLAGSYPVTIRKAAGAVLFSVGWGRSSGGCGLGGGRLAPALSGGCFVPGCGGADHFSNGVTQNGASSGYRSAKCR